MDLVQHKYLAPYFCLRIITEHYSLSFFHTQEKLIAFHAPLIYELLQRRFIVGKVQLRQIVYGVHQMLMSDFVEIQSVDCRSYFFLIHACKE